MSPPRSPEAAPATRARPPLQDGSPTSAPRSPDPQKLAQHPELGHLVLLAHHLEILTTVLTTVHAGGGQPEALTHHARGMVQVLRILRLQIDAYRDLLSMPQAPSTHGRT